VAREREFPIGAAVTVEALDRDPHPLLAELRAREPVSWIPALDGWLVTRYDLALEVMRDAARFTVDDPRFSTAQVIGPSMLSLDHAEHARHRAPFVGPFRARAVHDRFDVSAADEAERLVERLRPAGRGELRRGVAGPYAATIITRALGLGRDEAETVLGWYDAISATVTGITAGTAVGAGTGTAGDTSAGTAAGTSTATSAGSPGEAAFDELSRRLADVIDEGHGRGGSLLAAAAADTDLGESQIISNAAVLLFGGIETTEGMIANALLHLLSHEDALARVYAEPQLLTVAIEESLRLEPAAAVVDRYATENVTLGGAEIGARELVRVSIAGANRDPAMFAEPDRFDLSRRNSRRHLAFAQGPHVCVGVHLARLEARSALLALLQGLPGLELDPEQPAAVRGLVFRKPVELNARWHV
jgi:cytochrome P450